MNTIIKIYRTINHPATHHRWWNDAFLTIPRIVCGVLLAKDFGADKFGMPWSPPDRNLGLFEVIYWFPEDVAAYGGIFALFPVFFAWMGAFSEAVGGILLTIGWNTRIAAFLICCTMLVAIFAQKWGQGVWGMLPAMGFLWVGMFYLVSGSGRFGVDYFIHQRLNPK